MPTVAIVTVTFNSGEFFPKFLRSLEEQSQRPNALIIVDSGSQNTSYLHLLDASPLAYEVILGPNNGICVGNNLGWLRARDFDYVLFLNPDAFLWPAFIENAVSYMEDERHSRVGIVTGTLLGYDIDAQKPTGLVDSTGIIQTWYGRLVDRDQRSPEGVLSKYPYPNKVSAICSAAVFCRQAALSAIAHGQELFDPRFFMYKDDIDVTWRVRLAGWELVHNPDLRAYHCRGWKTRSNVPRHLRLMSARNEVYLFYKYRSPYILVALAKYVVVRALGV